MRTIIKTVVLSVMVFIVAITYAWAMTEIALILNKVVL